MNGHSLKIDSSDEEMAGHALTIFLEGFETSSSGLSYVLYDLAQNPAIQDRLKAEIDEVLDNHDNKFTYEALQDMPFLECVVHGTYNRLSLFF